jgi:predicted component of type VI protein secretion system
MDEISARYSGILREQLRLESESHVKEMTQALKEQSEELDSEWAEEMNSKLSQQQGYYQVELARAKARLDGVEAMVESVANAGVCAVDGSPPQYRVLVSPLHFHHCLNILCSFLCRRTDTPVTGIAQLQCNSHGYSGPTQS